MRNQRFEEYFLKYKNLVIRIVMDKTRDYQTAQEICQQVFVSLYKNMDKITPDLVKAWLMRCTQNAVIDYMRSNTTKKEVVSDTPISEVGEKGNTLPAESIDICEDRIANMELAGKILRDVRQVNERWYEVLMLHCIDGLSHEEAAAKLGISETVLRARLCRARAYVRKRYSDEYKEL